LGTLVSHGLRSGFNLGARFLVALTLFFRVAVHDDEICVQRAHSGRAAPRTDGKIGICSGAAALAGLAAEREQERMRASGGERRIVGRKPVAPQITGKSQPEKEQPKGIKLRT